MDYKLLKGDIFCGILLNNCISWSQFRDFDFIQLNYFTAEHLSFHK